MAVIFGSAEKSARKTCIFHSFFVSLQWRKAFRLLDVASAHHRALFLRSDRCKVFPQPLQNFFPPAARLFFNRGKGLTSLLLPSNLLTPALLQRHSVLFRKELKTTRPCHEAHAAESRRNVWPFEKYFVPLPQTMTETHDETD